MINRIADVVVSWAELEDTRIWWQSLRNERPKKLRPNALLLIGNIPGGVLVQGEASASEELKRWGESPTFALFKKLPNLLRISQRSQVNTKYA
jgi:hypothetical protein